MNLPEKLNSLFRVPPLTRQRLILALVIAVAADGLQLLFGPLGWVFIDQAIDCVAMIELGHRLSRALPAHLCRGTGAGFGRPAHVDRLHGGGHRLPQTGENPAPGQSDYSCG